MNLKLFEPLLWIRLENAKRLVIMYYRIHKFLKNCENLNKHAMYIPAKQSPTYFLLTFETQKVPQLTTKMFLQFAEISVSELRNI